MFSALGLLAATVAAITILYFRGPAVWFNLRHSFLAAGYGLAWLAQRVELGTLAVRWGEALRDDAARLLVLPLVRHMLGPDPDSLFIPDGHDGLRTPRARNYLVDTEASGHLKRKLSHLEDGTVAVCGPRGAGKTTLLEQQVTTAGFGVLAQAPATYTPHEFLLTLSVRLCRTYMAKHRAEIPEFTRLSPFGRFLKRMRKRARRLGRWGAYALPATALLILSFSSPIRALYTRYAEILTQFAIRQAHRAADLALGIWHGQAVAASVIAVLVAFGLWNARNTSWIPRLLRLVTTKGCLFLGALLIVGTFLSVLVDYGDISVHFSLRPLNLTTDPVPQPLDKQLPWEALIRAGLVLSVWVLFARARDSGIEFPLGSRHIHLRRIFTPLTTLAGACTLLYLAQDPDTYRLVADEANPLRLAAFTAGTLLRRVDDWEPRPREPELVSRCRDYLYRLQTIQSSGNSLTTGISQFLSLGTTHNTSLSTVPPNFPELVEDFRALLRLIAHEYAEQGKTVIIAIDELDRLGSDTTALAFLSEIKAILGIPHVHYLLSVAEDVGAAFVRRGLPHRDVTDSSLDDIIHVQPSTLAESRIVLAERSALTTPYTLLAHAFSGGILRYALQIREMQERSRSHELAEISRHLILEELSETLAGFRALLSKRQWTPDTEGTLSAFRILGGHLRNPCPCNIRPLAHGLQQLAYHPLTGHRPVPNTSDTLSEDTHQLMAEASAYAYFSLTLLDIFSTTGFDERLKQAQTQGFPGEPERLAEARQELGISPYSARTLITDIRKAWSLPLSPDPSGPIPPQRTASCTIHPAT
ncbi:P-loop NTPase fold protein [Streptomyces sp. NPDC090231]|uniref:P-loop NTPase fold protein n=1 Tax=unclassified Streptomyces TaxID=2593676 RepID=UPI0037FEE86D